MTKTLLLLYNPDTVHLSKLKAIGSGWNIIHTTNRSEAEEFIKNAEVVMGNHHLSESLPFNNGSIRWIQTNSIGIDHIKSKCGDYLDNIILTNARGVYNDEISEHAIGLILLLQRQLHLMRDAQKHHNWNRPVNLPLLKNKNILIIGYGSLGKSIHNKLVPFGCNVFGINTIVQNFKINKEKKHWKDHLQAIDILLMALPSTDNTKKYIGKEELKKLPANAFVINIGRSDTLDEETLFEMLRKNEIAGAALDVFDNEPIQKDSSVWDIQNLFISPHMARTREVIPPFKFEKLFEENFKRYIHGEALLNIVDLKKGY
jgi:phosphoglycerate dehydrogenase-like enzyme